MKTSMPLGLSASTGDMPRSSRLPLMTGMSTSGSRLRARAQSSRSSMLCGVLQTRKDVQDVRHGGADHSATPELEIQHGVLKVALQPWQTFVGIKLLIDYTTGYKVGDAYFRAERFCRYQHQGIADRRAIRQSALDWASGSNDGHVVTVRERDVGSDQSFLSFDLAI